MYLTPPLKWFPFDLGIGAGSKTGMMRLPDGQKVRLRDIVNIEY